MKHLWKFEGVYSQVELIIMLLMLIELITVTRKWCTIHCRIKLTCLISGNVSFAKVETYKSGMS